MYHCTAPASERALKDKQDPILPVLPPVFTVQLCVLELHLPLTLRDAIGLCEAVNERIKYQFQDSRSYILYWLKLANKPALKVHTLKIQ